MELKPQTILQGGRYVIHGVLGRGGFGVTYLAEQVMAKRKVCIKEFFPKDYYTRGDDTRSLTLASQGFAESMNRYKEKFVKEAQTIAALDHANIIPIYDVFEENNTAYYVMEYIDGESLSEVVKRRGALAESEAVEYVRQAASALEYLHERKIMHLDIKPGNIMLRCKDNRVVLIDFGLSKHYDEHSGEATSTTPVGVSHGYAPMEQYKQGGVNTFSPETDIYSLGATLYYMVTDKVPPEAATLISEPLEFPQHVSTTLRSAITAAMALSPKQRPASVGKFVAMLNGVGAEGDTIPEPKPTPNSISKPNPKPTPNPKPVASKPKSRKWWLWLIVLFALVAIIGGVIGVVGDNDSQPVVTLGEAEFAAACEEEYTDTTYYECDEVVVYEEEEYIEVTEAITVDQESLTTAPYDIGDYYNENGKKGIVFEVWDGGRHGKIVSMDETEAVWDSRVVRNSSGVCCNGVSTSANSKTDGMANTNMILDRVDYEYFSAFTWCREKGNNWYLPTRQELRIIETNREIIDVQLDFRQGDKLSNFYWTSEEVSKFTALAIGFGNIYSDWHYDKSRICPVRAVSAF